MDDLIFRDTRGGIHTAATYADGAFYFNWSAGFVKSISASWDIVAIGEFNGDGIDDLLWRNDNGAFSNWLGTGNEYVFQINDPNAYAQVPIGWQVAEPMLM